MGAWKKWGSSPAFIAVVALALRIIILLAAWHRMPTRQLALEPYGFEIGQVARSLVQGRGFSSPLYLVDTGPTAWFPPVFPYMLAGVFKIWGVYSLYSLLVIKSLNCIFSALTIFPVFAAAKRSFGPEIAILSSWLWVGLPSAWHIPVMDVWDSSLSALCFAVLFAATLALSESDKMRDWIGYGLLCAACAMVNASLLSLTPFFLVWLARRLRSRSIRWSRLVSAAVLFLLLGLAPWTVRNYHQFHALIPVRSNFGLELWLGNNLEAATVNSFALHPIWNSQEAEDYKRSGEIIYMQTKQREAIAFMQTHPREALQLRVHFAFAHWFHVSDRPDASWGKLPAHLKVFFIVNFFIIVSSWIGAAVAWRNCNSYAMPYFVVLLVYPLVFYLTHSLVRYRFPMETVLTILSSYALVLIAQYACDRTLFRGVLTRVF